MKKRVHIRVGKSLYSVLDNVQKELNRKLTFRTFTKTDASEYLGQALKQKKIVIRKTGKRKGEMLIDWDIKL